MQESYSVRDIFDLVNTGRVELPTVQRAFVWKSYQIENLWDSLLRGYPAGAFVFARQKDSDVLLLLDGQQRAASIFLAFCDSQHLPINPAFRHIPDTMRIFLDLGKLNVRDSRKYVFRVITAAHPWGFQRLENRKILEAKDIRLAQSNAARYGHALSLNDSLPYDAWCPVPFSLFLHAASCKAAEQNLTKWKETLPHPEHYMDIELYSVQEIWQDMQYMLEYTRIPALYLNMDRITYSAGEANLVSDAETADALENLFIRLNSGGTALRGEELNYCILKSRIDRNLQQKLEEACRGIFAPSRFVTLAFRLFQQRYAETDALSMHIRPEQIQFWTGRGRSDFSEYIAELAENGSIAAVRTLLLYHPQKNPYGLPYFICSSFADKFPEVMFILLYRLWIAGDSFDARTASIYRRMAGMLTLFAWFGRGKSGREHARVLKKAAARCNADQDTFWSAKTVRAVAVLDTDTNKPILVLPPDVQTAASILQDTACRSIRELAQSNPEYADFLCSFLHNRDLLLYAQREALYNFFSATDYTRYNDTDQPYDLDHIFPQSWIKNRKHTPPALREWYQSIGNLRAWPYAFNRSDQDDPPEQKMTADPQTFAEICTMLPTVPTFDAKSFYRWSLCDPEQIKAAAVRNYADLKKKMPTVIAIIRARALHLYEKWYTDLAIADLTDEIRQR